MAAGGPEREDLAEVLARRALTEDAARPDAVERRHAAGGRTARENVADLVDAGSFVEYGRFAIAAQRGRRELAGPDRAHAGRRPRSPAPPGSTASCSARRAACAVLSYDYTVLAGTQGALGHRKKDRLFELIERMRLPTVFFAEGGGGRPGDTDYPVVSALDTRAFALWARLSGVVPRIAVVAGRCFAGNAVIAGCSDLIVATENASLGMGGPAMIAGGGLGEVDPDEVGPIAMQAANGVVDVVVADEAEAVAVTKRLLGYFQGATAPGPAPDQARLRELVPERAPPRLRRSRPIVETLADDGSVTFLRERFAPEMVTALARIEGRPVGIIANDTRHMAGAITSDAADKAARLPAALRRVRAAAPLARRHARDDGRPRRRGDRPGPPRLAAARRRRGAAGAARRGGPAPRLRPRRAGDGRRQPARAAADGRLAGRPPRRRWASRARCGWRCARSSRRSPTRPSASSASASSPRPPRRTRRRSTRPRCSSSTTSSTRPRPAALIAATLAAAAPARARRRPPLRRHLVAALVPKM